jgi:hypothetical protein
LPELADDARPLNRISGGLEAVSRLVGAAAVLSMLARATAIPLSKWFAAGLNAYAAVFHPIVDHTIGLVPAAFGLALLPVAKDAIVLYGMVSGAFFRTFQQIPREEGENPTLQTIGMSLTWPVSIPVVLFLVWALDGVAGGNPEAPRWLARFFRRSVTRELLLIVVIVALAAALNAAGVLA